MSELFVYAPNPTPYKWPWTTSRRCGVLTLIGLAIQCAVFLPGNDGFETVGFVVVCIGMAIYLYDGLTQ